MKKLIYSIYIIISVVAIPACSKSFLETTPRQGTDAELVITNLAGARAALIGTYSLMQSASYYGRTLPIIPDVLSDNMYLSRRNSNRYQGFDQFAITPNDGYARDLWNQAYRIIVNANIIINKASTLEFPATETAEANHIIGEAYVIRALAYFNLVRYYAMPYNYSNGAGHAGVPITTTGSYDKGNIIKPARNTVAEVYTLMIDDLKKAIPLLPATPAGFATTVRGRATLNAAKAILAKVYLFKEDWVNAEAMATEVITANKYTLLSNSTLAANFKTQNNSETIFEIQYNSTDNLGSDAMVNFCKQGGSYGDALGTDELYNLYTATDVRRAFAVKGKRTGSGGEDPAIQIAKYDNTTNYEEGIKIIRFAELYLMRAEARARQTGKDADAAQDLDVIRKRADASVASTTATGNDLVELILTERRKELAFEGHRLFDLTRYKKAYTKYRSGATIAVANNSLKTILPIPQAEIDVNKNVAQNEGYK